jgi:hypothetical protein
MRNSVCGGSGAPEAVLQAAQRLEHFLGRLAEERRAALDRVAQLLGAPAHGVVIAHGGFCVEPAHRLLQLPEAAAHTLGHHECRLWRTRGCHGRKVRARKIQGLEPVACGLGVEHGEHAHPGVRAAFLEPRLERRGRLALLPGQVRAVTAQPRQLHVEVARAAKSAQYAFGSAACVHERRR